MAKKKQEKHSHVILGLLILGLFVLTLVNSAGIEKINKIHLDDGEWECIEYVEYTYEECKQLRELSHKDLIELPKACGTWLFSCCMFGVVGLNYETEEQIEEKIRQQELDCERCKREMIFYGECIKWQKVKTSPEG